MWTAPCAPKPVHATVTIPGSKSQTNRALVLAALAAAQGQGASTISGALRSRDTDLMIGALNALGLSVDGAGSELTISGRIAPGPNARVDCGLAGTVLRFVPPLAALSAAPVTFDGDEQARARPIAPLLDALRGLGVRIDGTGLPFRVQGSGSVAGGAVAIDASASSQFVSGLLLCAASLLTHELYDHQPPNARPRFQRHYAFSHRPIGRPGAVRDYPVETRFKRPRCFSASFLCWESCSCFQADGLAVWLQSSSLAAFLGGGPGRVQVFPGSR